MPVTPVDSDQIVITASRAPEKEKDAPASVTIIDQKEIERLGDPLVPDLLRLVPSAAVSVSGPPGSLTDVRIRGAEANHTLLFIDGIRANDPASGDQPRFDLLNADIASRIEVIRGPQSAIWGSEAIGGVVAVNGTPETAPGYSGSIEGGSFGFARANGSMTQVSDVTSLAAAAGYQRATGIDSFNGHGDKDGYWNLSGRLRGTWRLSPEVQLGIAAFAIKARDDFDGFDPITFLHADTLDNSRNQMEAGRVWVQAGGESADWNGRVGVSLLGSSNRNYLADLFLNRTSGLRRTVDAQIERQITTGWLTQRLIVAADAERETFHARDTTYGGATDQDRTRDHDSITVEWRGDASRFAADLAVRRDIFNRFRDATTLRASLLAKIGGGFAVTGSYAEGISQPTFFDLYGFFPGSFVGNPSLMPETSRGFEASLRYNRGPFDASLTGYRQRLHEEITDTFDPATFLSSAINIRGVSHRSGMEMEIGWRIGGTLRLSANYAYLHATQPNDLAPGQVTELRRPKNSGSIALDGASGKFTYGGSIAYVGAHLDRNQDPPYQLVDLPSYWLAGARVAYALRSGFEVFVRAANAFNARYEDVYGYRTEGRAVYAGIRLSSPR
jgi:vitamin B12 transporter